MTARPRGPVAPADGHGVSGSASPPSPQVDGDIPPRVKKDAHELILDFIRSRPPLKQVSERRLRPVPQKQRTLHEKILEEIKQERRLRPVGAQRWGGRGERVTPSPARPPQPPAPPHRLASPRVRLSALHPQRLLWGRQVHFLHQPVHDGCGQRCPAPAAAGPAQSAHLGGDGGDDHV